jgi:hypothetical protein
LHSRDYQASKSGRTKATRRLKIYDDAEPDPEPGKEPDRTSLRGVALRTGQGRGLRRAIRAEVPMSPSQITSQCAAAMKKTGLAHR